MTVKILGAVLILTGCGGFGMLICLAYKREEEMLRQMIRAMDCMESELQFRMTPLPELCIRAGNGSSGSISRFWNSLSEELQRASSPDVEGCANAAMDANGPFPQRVEMILEQLSDTLGQFDAPAQIRALEAARTQCHRVLEAMGTNRENRLRSYQTLGICTGIALVIILV